MTTDNEHPEKACPFCAGTGKIRDYKIDPSGMPASTFFTVNPAGFRDFNFTAMCGT